MASHDDFLTMAQVRALTIDHIETTSSDEVLALRRRIPAEAWKPYPHKQRDALFELEVRARVLGAT